MHKLWPPERLLRSLPVPATKIVGALVAGALLAGGGTIAAVHTPGHKANTTVDLSSGAAAGNGSAGAQAGGGAAVSGASAGVSAGASVSPSLDAGIPTVPTPSLSPKPGKSPSPAPSLSVPKAISTLLPTALPSVSPGQVVPSPLPSVATTPLPTVTPSPVPLPSVSPSFSPTLDKGSATVTVPAQPGFSYVVCLGITGSVPVATQCQPLTVPTTPTFTLTLSYSGLVPSLVTFKPGSCPGGLTLTATGITPGATVDAAAGTQSVVASVQALNETVTASLCQS